MSPLREITDLYERKSRHHRGFIEFNLDLKGSLLQAEMDEEKKRKVRLLMSKGVQNEKEYPKRFDRRIRRRRSDRYHPAADYFRCYLSKAAANVMSRLTQRYKNEAARREFYTELAKITEAIHLSASDDRISALFENRDSGLVDAVLRETAALSKGSFDPNEEMRQKLGYARQEFSNLLKRAESLLGVKWEKSEKYDEHLALVSFFDPWHLEDEKTERWGVAHYSNPTTLNVNPPVMYFDALRRSIVAREAISHLTPRIADSVPRLYEQSEYLATKLLEDKYEKEFWLFARHGLREETKKDSITGVSEFFGYYENFVGDDLYKQAWSRLAEMERLSLQINSVAEYGRILDAIAARPIRVRLTQHEIALFNVLSERPNMPMSELAQRIGTSIPTASKLMERLTQKASLRFYIHANDRALGLDEWLILMRTPKPDRLPSVVWRIPYCRDVYRLYGPMDYFIVVNVPQEKTGFARKLESVMMSCGLASQVIFLKAISDHTNMSFEYFEPEESVWHVHWDSWGAGLAKAMKERQAPVNPQSYPQKTESVKFDKLDLQILEQLMYNGRSSYSEIGKALGITGAYVSRKIHRLLRNRVFRPVAKPFKIGAEEYALVTIECKDDCVEPLIGSLNKLPAWRGAAVKGGFDGILAQVGVPSGEINQLFMVLDDRLVKTRLANCSFNVVGMYGSGSSLRRWLPISLYSKNEGWKFEESRYLDLVDQYGRIA
jgi:DNA-binding Lrp family transcriptional regulator